MLNLTNNSIDELEDLLTEEMIDTGQKAELIVYNDDHNTFDWVIECFMDICDHTFEQAEQLSILVHFKGKACVKTGILEDLQPMKQALINRGLSAIIESFADK